MASKPDTWEHVLRENVVHGSTREAEVIYRRSPSWGISRPIGDADFEIAPSRPSHRRTSRDWGLLGQAFREFLDPVNEVDTFTEELPVYGPVVRIVSTSAISPAEPPDMLAPQMVKVVMVGGEAVVTSEGHEDLPLSPPSEIEVLISALRVYGREEAASRIQVFLTTIDEDPDEPPIVRESLLSMVQFLIQEAQLLPPIVSSDPYGLMELEWHLLDNGDPNTLWGRGNGVVSLKFLKSGSVQYVALSGPKRKGQDRLTRRGNSSKCGMLSELGEFAERITAT